MQTRNNNNILTGSALSNFLKQLSRIELAAQPILDDSNTIINAHQNDCDKQFIPAYDPNTINTIKDIFSKFADIYRQINFLSSTLANNSDDPESKKITSELKKLKGKLDKNLYFLKKTTAEKYYYAQEKYSSIPKKIEFLEKAKSLLLEIKITSENVDRSAPFVRKGDKVIIEEFLNYVVDNLNHYRPNSNNELAKKILEAHSKKDKDEAYQAFEDALSLTKDTIEKFTILFDQGENYYKKLYKDKHYDSATLKHEYEFEIVKKASRSLILAAQIATNLDNEKNIKEIFNKSETICNELNQKAALIKDYVATTCVKDKLEALIEAKKYIDCIKKLLSKLQSLQTLNSAQVYDLRKTAEANAQLSSEIMKLSSNIIKENIQKKLAEEQEKAAKIAAENYAKSEEGKQKQAQIDARIQQLIAEFDRKKTPKIHVSKRSKPIGISKLYSDNETVDENCITQYNYLTNPTIAKFYINLDHQLFLLNAAKTNDDLLTQIKVNTTIAEYYLIQGLETDNQAPLKQALDYIKSADEILSKISSEFTEVQKCVSIVLENIDRLIGQFTLRIIWVDLCRKQGRDAAMADIIARFGWEAWFQDDLDKIAVSIKNQAEIDNTYNELVAMKNIAQTIANKYELPNDNHSSLPMTTAATLPLINTESENPAESVQIFAAMYEEISILNNEIIQTEDEDIIASLKIKQDTLITQYINHARQDGHAWLEPLFNSSQLMDYFFYYCINKKSAECFIEIKDTLLPFMLPIPLANWPFTQEISEEISKELKQIDEYNKIPTYLPKDPWSMLSHFIMAILARTDLLQSSLSDVLDRVSDYLPMNIFFEKLIEIYQNFYLRQQKVANSIPKISDLSMFGRNLQGIIVTNIVREESKLTLSL